MKDVWLLHLDVLNHEAAHAGAMFIYGRPIKEIDVDRPDQWAAGHVVPGEMEPIPAPPDDVKDKLGWIEAQISRSRRESAVIARIGSMVGGQDWYGPESRVDRAILLEACPPWLTPDAWELLVQSWAEELRDDRFKVVLRALAFELGNPPHDVMTGGRAAEIAEAALTSL